jgi:hypothetical protein
MRVISSTELDLAAPILPGEGAAGLRIGTRIPDLPAALLSRFTIHRRVNSCVPNAVLTTYRADGITLYVENRVIDQIAVSGAYHGALSGPHGSIGVGSTVAEVEQRIGTVVGDDEGNLSIAGISGLCFDVGATFNHVIPAGDPNLRHLPLKTIFVHRF